MRGPLPSGDAVRRNAPTIPAQQLPASGRKGRAPKCPYDLGPAGAEWWRWAWRTPQAAGWNDGDLYALARRAQLEDDLKVIEDPSVLLEGEDVSEVVEQVIRALKSLAGGKLAVAKECRELDERFGLTLKSMKALRLKIAEDEVDKKRQEKPEGTRARLKAVDHAVAGG